MTRRHPLVAVLGFGLCVADAAPGLSQSYAPGFQPQAEERVEIRRYLDEADSWSHHFFTMRFFHPFDPGQSRYLLVSADVIVVEGG